MRDCNDDLTTAKLLYVKIRSRLTADELLTRWPKNSVAADDILDAHAACWTAERILKGEAVQIPPTPEIDAKGLQMEMWV